MFVSLKANKKRMLAFLVLAAAVVGACVFLRWGKDGGEEPAPAQVFGETNEERLAYLQSFGWQADPQPAETREVMIPAQFNDVYQNYNAMQQAQGFDLAPYAGEVCTQYKYHITNYPGETEVYATLLVYGRLVIGGDLACAEVDGFMHGFARDSARYGEATPQPEATQPAASEPKSGEESDYVNSGAPQSSQAETGAEVSNAENPVETVESSAPETGAESTAGEVLDQFPTD